VAKRKKGSSLDNFDKTTPSSKDEGRFYFVCPNHGRIPREEVAFLCNTCGHEELLEKGEILLCPQCLQPGENFQCFLCGSKEVKLREVKPSRKKH